MKYPKYVAMVSEDGEQVGVLMMRPLGLGYAQILMVSTMQETEKIASNTAQALNAFDSTAFAALCEAVQGQRDDDVLGAAKVLVHHFGDIADVEGGE